MQTLSTYITKTAELDTGMHREQQGKLHLHQAKSLTSNLFKCFPPKLYMTLFNILQLCPANNFTYMTHN